MSIVDQRSFGPCSCDSVDQRARARTCALTAADLSKLSTIVGWVLLQLARAHPRGFLRKLRVVVGGGGPKMDVWQLRISCDSCCWQAGGGGSGACVSIFFERDS